MEAITDAKEKMHGQDFFVAPCAHSDVHSNTTQHYVQRVMK